MKYRVVIYTQEEYPYTFGSDANRVTETRTREVEQYSQKINSLNVLDIILAVNGRCVMPTTKEIIADWEHLGANPGGGGNGGSFV